MGHGEHGDHLVTCGNVALAEIYAGAEVAVGEHDALGVAGGTGGVVDGGEVVPVVSGEDNVIGLHAFGPLGVEELVHGVIDFLDLGGGGIEGLPGVHVDDETDCWHVGDVHVLPLVLVGEKDHALGVVCEESCAFGGEVCQDRDYDGLVSVDGEVAHTPAGAVAGAEGDFLSLLDAEFVEYEVEFFDLSGHLAVSVGLASDAVEGGLLPVFAGSVLKTLQIMRIFFHLFWLLVFAPQNYGRIEFFTTGFARMWRIITIFVAKYCYLWRKL